jgi:hypothetical protein
LGHQWSTTNASRFTLQKTRATRVSETVFFKHQYITNPTISPESLVVAVAQQLTTALKGNIPAGNKTVEALKKVSKLFTKIAEAKAKAAKAKEQQNRIRTHPNAHHAIPLPRVAKQNPRVELAIPSVDEAPKADCCIAQIVTIPTVSWLDAQSSTTGSQSWSPRLDAQSPAVQSNYISQDEEADEEPQGYNTRSQTTSIMQEAMLACVDISKPMYILSQDHGLLNYREKPTFKISAKQLSTHKIPMTWFCELANSVLGEKGKLLKYWHLIGNPKMKAVWAHSHGNKIG